MFVNNSNLFEENIKWNIAKQQILLNKPMTNAVTELF